MSEYNYVVWRRNFPVGGHIQRVSPEYAEKCIMGFIRVGCHVEFRRIYVTHDGLYWGELVVNDTPIYGVLVFL